MIVEQRTYTLTVGGHVEWFRLYEEEIGDKQQQILGNMIGYFRTEIGPLNQIIHMWGYDSLDDRDRRRAELGKQDWWQAVLPKLRVLMIDQESKILVPAPFSPIR